MENRHGFGLNTLKTTFGYFKDSISISLHKIFSQSMVSCVLYGPHRRLATEEHWWDIEEHKTHLPCKKVKWAGPLKVDYQQQRNWSLRCIFLQMQHWWSCKADGYKKISSNIFSTSYPPINAKHNCSTCTKQGTFKCLHLETT